MNEIVNIYQYIPYMIKNTWIELRYNVKQYVTWLLFNLGVIFMTFLVLNLMSSLPGDKTTRLFQLSGYLIFFWMAGAIYFSSMVLSRRGFILNITDVPLYVLVNIQIINFLLTFVVSFIMLQLIRLSNAIQIDMSVIGVIYFIVMTYLLLIPVCTLFALFKHYTHRMKRIVIIILGVLFLLVPVLWVPSNLPEVIVNLLRLNPFFFLVNGFEESVVLGTSAFYNIPNHFLFIAELIFIYLWAMYFYRLLKDEININKR